MGLCTMEDSAAAGAQQPVDEPAEEAPPGQTHVHTLYMGNLNPRYSREVLCSMLKDILGTASFPLQRHHIEVVKKARRAYALVQVATELSLEHVLKQLQVASDTEQQLLRELVMKGKTLVVGEGKRASLGTKEGQESDTEGTGASAPGPPGLGHPQSGRSRPRGAEDAQPSPWRKTPPQARRLVERPAAFLSGTRSDSAIVRQEIVGQERLFYGAFMGSETRNVEFKRGGGEYLSVTLKHHVRKLQAPGVPGRLHPHLHPGAQSRGHRHLPEGDPAQRPPAQAARGAAALRDGPGGGLPAAGRQHPRAALRERHPGVVQAEMDRRSAEAGGASGSAEEGEGQPAATAQPAAPDSQVSDLHRAVSGRGAGEASKAPRSGHGDVDGA
ncbi:schlafen-like protein 1 isoform X2 [Pelodiscus sinensis]|uniref:schlafen-like protein 1 isoform X2 n=1 Tax=Pelodiscus sinensis TaxID=13735 RepID=UPI003F6B519F